MVGESEGPPKVRFAGYAAVFNRVDNGGDVVRAGAFARTLRLGNPVPLLWQHRTGAVVGQIEKLAEDSRGLRVTAQLGNRHGAQDIAAALRAGKRLGLSFGYRVRKSQRRDEVRHLEDLDLVEVSVVTNPMQPLARIHAVES